MVRKLMLISVACFMVAAGPAAAFEGHHKGDHKEFRKIHFKKKCRKHKKHEHDGGGGGVPEIDALAGLAALGGLGAALMAMRECRRRRV